MDTAGASIPMVIQGATYPFELFSDAKFLRDQARASVARDSQNIPNPRERAFSRATIFTAFNFLESLLTELTQEYISTGPGAGHAYSSNVTAALQGRRAKISSTMSEWTSGLLGRDITTSPAFVDFVTITRFRNQLIHPKLILRSAGELTQDQLLRRANADEAAWVFGQICRMAVALYGAFGQQPEPDIITEENAAPPARPAQL